MLTFGTGIGGGIISEGKLLRGREMLARLVILQLTSNDNEICR